MAPAVDRLGAGVLLEGESVVPQVSRIENVIHVDTDTVHLSASAVDAETNRLVLAADGSLQLTKQDLARLEINGFAPSSDVSVWMFSKPSPLGVGTTGANGTFAQSFPLPPGIQAGQHRLVLSGQSVDGKRITFAIATTILDMSGRGGSSFNAMIIAIPLILAILGALFLPAIVRRRRSIP